MPTQGVAGGLWMPGELLRPPTALDVMRLRAFQDAEDTNALNQEIAQLGIQKYKRDMDRQNRTERNYAAMVGSEEGNTNALAGPTGQQAQPGPTGPPGQVPYTNRKMQWDPNGNPVDQYGRSLQPPPQQQQPQAVPPPPNYQAQSQQQPASTPAPAPTQDRSFYPVTQDQARLDKMTATTINQKYKWYELAVKTAQAEGIPVNHFLAMIQAESSFNPTAKSPAGAMGIAQFMPGTWAAVTGRPFSDALNPEIAIPAMAKHYKELAQITGGDPYKIAWAYNAGPGAVKRGILPAETANYIATIQGYLASFGRIRGGIGVEEYIPTADGRGWAKTAEGWVPYEPSLMTRRAGGAKPDEPRLPMYMLPGVNPDNIDDTNAALWDKNGRRIVPESAMNPAALAYTPAQLTNPEGAAKLHPNGDTVFDAMAYTFGNPAELEQYEGGGNRGGGYGVPGAAPQAQAPAQAPTQAPTQAPAPVPQQAAPASAPTQVPGAQAPAPEAQVRKSPLSPGPTPPAQVPTAPVPNPVAPAQGGGTQAPAPTQGQPPAQTPAPAPAPAPPPRVVVPAYTPPPPVQTGGYGGGPPSSPFRPTSPALLTDDEVQERLAWKAADDAIVEQQRARLLPTFKQGIQEAAKNQSNQQKKQVLDTFRKYKGLTPEIAMWDGISFEGNGETTFSGQVNKDMLNEYLPIMYNSPQELAQAVWDSAYLNENHPGYPAEIKIKNGKIDSVKDLRMTGKGGGLGGRADLMAAQIAGVSKADAPFFNEEAGKLNPGWAPGIPIDEWQRANPSQKWQWPDANTIRKAREDFNANRQRAGWKAREEEVDLPGHAQDIYWGREAVSQLPGGMMSLFRPKIMSMVHNMSAIDNWTRANNPGWEPQMSREEWEAANPGQTFKEIGPASKDNPNWEKDRHGQLKPKGFDSTFNFEMAQANFEKVKSGRNIQMGAFALATLNRVGNMHDWAQQIAQTDFPTLNAAMNWLGMMTGQEGPVALQALHTAFVMEANQVLTGSATSSDFRVRKDLEAINMNWSPRQYLAAVDNLTRAILARLEAAYQDMYPIEVVQGRMPKEVFVKHQLEKYMAIAREKAKNPNVNIEQIAPSLGVESPPILKFGTANTDNAWRLQENMEKERRLRELEQEKAEREEAYSGGNKESREGRD